MKSLFKFGFRSGQNQGIFQKIFASSKLNGAPYTGDKLPQFEWRWPKDTWLQRRRKNLDRPSAV